MRWLLKRWWFWAGTGFMLVAVCAGYLLIPEGRISEASCDKIQIGMTFEQVTSLLGNRYLSTSETLASWSDDEDFDGNIINVFFDVERDEVIKKKFRPTKLPFHERLKRRIARRIRALWP